MLSKAAGAARYGRHGERQASMTAPLEAYVADSGAGCAAEPVPLYAEQLGWAPGQIRSPDVNFSLLQLHSGNFYPNKICRISKWVCCN